MGSYKGITFAKGYKNSFAKFKEEFSQTHVFKSIPHKERETELEKAYLIANPNGKLPTSKKKGGKADTGED